MLGFTGKTFALRLIAPSPKKPSALMAAAETVLFSVTPASKYFLHCFPNVNALDNADEVFPC